MVGCAHPTLKRGANNRCAYGAGGDGLPLALRREGDGLLVAGTCYSGMQEIACHVD